MLSRKALCVGIDHYKHEHKYFNLDGCVNDANEVKEVLSINEDRTPNFDVEILISQSPKCGVERKTLKNYVIELFQEDCDIALFYFSGHGHMDDITGGYLVTSECEDGDEGLSFHDLLSIASQSHARYKVLILDCCYAGSAGNIVLSKDISLIKEGLIIFSACRGDQGASEENNGGVDGGVFTTLLLDALRGGAMDLVGNVTPGSVYTYIDQLLGQWDQRPTFKANVSSFVTLRKNNPPIPLEDLHKLTIYFENPDSRYRLDSTYERTSGNRDEEHVIIFKILQRYNRVGLVVPVDAEHMYDAAMESKSCKLTSLGKHYWDLVHKKRI